MSDKRFEQCQNELRRYELSNLEYQVLEKQIKNICEELDNNDIDETVHNILSEVFEENNINPRLKELNKTSEVLEISCKFGGDIIKFGTEELKRLNVKNIFGGVELDFTKFQFAQGDIKINAKNTFGGVVIYINEETEVQHYMSNFAGGVDNTLYYNPTTAKHTITVLGKNKMGSVQIITTNDAATYRQSADKEAWKNEKKKMQLEKKHQQELMKLEKKRLKSGLYKED